MPLFHHHHAQYYFHSKNISHEKHLCVITTKKHINYRDCSLSLGNKGSGIELSRIWISSRPNLIIDYNTNSIPTTINWTRFNQFRLDHWFGFQEFGSKSSIKVISRSGSIRSPKLIIYCSLTVWPAFSFQRELMSSYLKFSKLGCIV